MFHITAKFCKRYKLVAALIVTARVRYMFRVLDHWSTYGSVSAPLGFATGPVWSGWLCSVDKPVVYLNAALWLGVVINTSPPT